MKFQYLRTVETPASHAGAEGTVQDREPWVCRQLEAEGYGKALEPYPEIEPSPPASPYPEQEEAPEPVVIVDAIPEPLDEGGDAESSES